MRKLFTRSWIVFVTPIILLMAAGLLVLVYLIKFFKRGFARDPFHDSRRHPLNDPEAPRG